jgi:hypothetical protein
VHVALKISEVRDATSYPIRVLHLGQEITPQFFKMCFIVLNNEYAFEVLVYELQHDALGCFASEPTNEVRYFYNGSLSGIERTGSLDDCVFLGVIESGASNLAECGALGDDSLQDRSYRFLRGVTAY